MLLLMPPSAGFVAPTIAITAALLGMLILAALDVWKQEVEDYATVALFVVIAGSLVIHDVAPAQWVGGLLAGAVAFLVYMNLGLRGVVGGGDVKLAAVPAFALGVSSPIAGLWWITCALLLHQLLIVIARRVSGHAEGGARASAEAAPIAIPHVPAMALALVSSAVIFPPYW